MENFKKNLEAAIAAYNLRLVPEVVLVSVEKCATGNPAAYKVVLQTPNGVNHTAFNGCDFTYDEHDIAVMLPADGGPAFRGCCCGCG